MSRTAFKFLRDMWRHLAAMSLLLALMFVLVLVLELAAREGPPTSAGVNPVTRSDIHHWAVHPGGEKVINAMRDVLGLSEKQLEPTRRVLANYGNMSSPTVWFVLREIQGLGIERGQYVVLMAFGAGLSAHAMLLEA